MSTNLMTILLFAAVIAVFALIVLIINRLVDRGYKKNKANPKKFIYQLWDKCECGYILWCYIAPFSSCNIRIPDKVEVCTKCGCPSDKFTKVSGRFDSAGNFELSKYGEVK